MTHSQIVPSPIPVENEARIDSDRRVIYEYFAIHLAGIEASEDGNSTARRYSPNTVTSQEVRIINGAPDEDRISTSYVERNNLTMRMGMRRFTRLTNAFSKKVENLEHALALHYMHYNFVRIHKTLRCTPAMEAGVTDRLWTVREIAELLDQAERARAA